MKDSVWVCSINYVHEGPREEDCPAFRDGKCYGRNGRICDAIEYAPVKRGKWEIVRDEKGMLMSDRWIYKCSVCGGEIDMTNTIDATGEKYPYCPCGAKMEE